MKINYTVNKDDFARAMDYFHGRNAAGLRPPSWPIRLGGGLLFFYAFFARELHIALAGGGAGPGLILGAVVLATLLVLAPRVIQGLLRLDVRRTVKYDLRHPRDYSLELLDDGFIESSDGLAVEIRRPRLKELVVDGEGRIFILARGLEFFVIPPSAFPGSAELEAFLDRLAEAGGLPVTGRDRSVS